MESGSKREEVEQEVKSWVKSIKINQDGRVRLRKDGLNFQAMTKKRPKKQVLDEVKHQIFHKILEKFPAEADLIETLLEEAFTEKFFST